MLHVSFVKTGVKNDYTPRFERSSAVILPSLVSTRARYGTGEFRKTLTREGIIRNCERVVECERHVENSLCSGCEGSERILFANFTQLLMWRSTSLQTSSSMGMAETRLMINRARRKIWKSCFKRPKNITGEQ